MPLFDFTLHPLEQIIPWGGKEGPYLSWFSLTDGYYAINTGPQRHYQYTPELFAFWEKNIPQLRIDMDYLPREHEQRKQSLTKALQTQSEPINWPEVFAANHTLQQKRTAHTT